MALNVVCCPDSGTSGVVGEADMPRQLKPTLLTPLSRTSAHLSRRSQGQRQMEDGTTGFVWRRR